MAETSILNHSLDKLNGKHY